MSTMGEMVGTGVAADVDVDVDVDADLAAAAAAAAAGRVEGNVCGGSRRWSSDTTIPFSLHLVLWFRPLFVLVWPGTLLILIFALSIGLQYLGTFVERLFDVIVE